MNASSGTEWFKDIFSLLVFWEVFLNEAFSLYRIYIYTDVLLMHLESVSKHGPIFSLFTAIHYLLYYRSNHEAIIQITIAILFIIFIFLLHTRKKRPVLYCMSSTIKYDILDVQAWRL